MEHGVPVPEKDMTVEDAFKRIRRGELETINILYVTDPTGICWGYCPSGTCCWRRRTTDPGHHGPQRGVREHHGRPRRTWPRPEQIRLPGHARGGQGASAWWASSPWTTPWTLSRRTTEDFFEKMAAMLPSDKPYLKSGISPTWRARLPWLMVPDAVSHLHGDDPEPL